MPDARAENVKKDIAAIAVKYGLEVVGYLGLDENTIIPAREMGLLEGVKWEDSVVDMSKVKNPLELMPSAKTLVIFGKRLLDEKYKSDMCYRISEDYAASVEMMMLDIAALKTMALLKKEGYQGEEYTSYYIKAWAALAGLGWIGRSRMFVSKDHGPRLRLKGVLTDADLGEPCQLISDESCGDCEECMKACPVGAITRDEVDRKKCGACPLNHRKLLEYTYSYCTACTFACPVGAGRKRQAHAPQAVSRQRITP